MESVIIQMRKDGASFESIATFVGASVRKVRRTWYEYRAKEGDMTARKLLKSMYHGRRKEREAKQIRENLVIYGKTIRTVTEYRCNGCGASTILSPCLTCLIRKHSTIVPGLRDVEIDLQLKLDPEQEARRKDILGKRGKECVDPILEYGGAGAGSSAPLSLPVSQDASCI